MWGFDSPVERGIVLRAKDSDKCKISPLLAENIHDLEALKEEFAPYPNGMTMDTLFNVLLRHIGKKRGDSDCFGLSQRNWLASRGETPASPQMSPRGIVKGTVPKQPQKTSMLSAGRPNNSFSSMPQKDALGALRDGLYMSPWKMGASHQHISGSWTDINAFENLFNRLDSDSDGLVSWDDIMQLAVEEATQSITIITEEMRSYSLSRISSQEKLVRLVHTLPDHKSVFAIASRADPLLLVSKEDFSVVKRFSFKDFDNNHPQLIEYLPVPDVLLAYSVNDKTLRGWWNAVSVHRMGTLSPLYLGDTIRRIRTQPWKFPYSFFTCSSNGKIVHWQLPKQRSLLEISRVHAYDVLHKPDTGGITDFTVTDEWIFSTGFDCRLFATNIETGRPILVGLPHDTIKFLEYNRNCDCLPSVSYSNRVLLWDVRSSSATPGATFRDEGARPHTADVIGLCNAPGLPQIITCDSMGMMKVWDLRALRCSQTLYADGTAMEDMDVDYMYSDQAINRSDRSFLFQALRKGNSKCIRSIGFFPNTQEVVCSSPEAIYCLRYNHRRDGHTADVEVVHAAFYDPYHSTIFLQGSARTSVWDAVDGFRRRLFDRSFHIKVPYWQQEVIAVCLDYPRNRLFFAIAGGTVEVRSSKNFVLLETFAMHEVNAQEMLFSMKHKMLVSISNNGFLTLLHEEDSGHSISNIGLSSLPLRALSLSDEAGLIACCDEHTLFFVDYKQTKLTFFSVKLNVPVRTTAMLGTYPVLATSSDDGELTLWSTPPAEESYTPLVSFFVGRSSPSFWRRKTVKSFSFSRCSPDRREQAEVSSFSAPLRSATEPEEEYPHGESSDFSEKLGEKERQKMGFTNLLEAIAADEKASGASTAISFDDVLHRLFVADQKGSLFIYSCCPFLQGFGFRRCSFENRSRYALWGMNDDFRTLHFPILLQTLSPHNGYITFMKWFPGLSAVVTCGSDHLVKILDYDGKETGQLRLDRLPPRSLLDETDGTEIKVYAEKTPQCFTIPFSLPPPFPALKRCEECARIEVELKDSRNSSLKELAKGSLLLPAANMYQCGSLVPLGETELTLPQPSAFVGVASEEVNCNRSKGTPSPPSVSLQLVALEEKKQWRPRREVPCVFREREYASATARTSFSGETISGRGSARQMCRTTPLPGMSSTIEWWRPGNVPTPPSFKKKKHRGTPTCSNDNNNNNGNGAGSGIEGARDDFKNFSGELCFSGNSVSPPSPVSLKLSEGLSAEGPKPVLDSSQNKLRESGRKFLKRNQKKKWTFIRTNRSEDETKAEMAEQSGSFLDNVLRTYEKELRRCVRGRNVMKRLCDNSPTARMTISRPTGHGASR
ncbi:hypothetical protein ECC02_001391 [Trypanosoma cruzi]|uniref:EF-hand domain-containing protein n=1 Tax=Trypanosoma cruzi TaxID=5693 RepID=A0A7J6YFZ4_TRYCR|nr:hypothetical protein ECC02_001391 [Trypanosoma cruzi]